MSEVKRYDMRVSLGGVESYESPCGDYVDYEDYAALEAKCVALAAENAWLKDYLAPIGLKVEGTPVTDAFLSEVRAQGVEMFGQHHNFSEKLFIQNRGAEIRRPAS